MAVFQGFLTIAAVIFVGWLGAHLGILDSRARTVLSNTSFFFASPALLFMIMARADLEHVLSWTLVVNTLAMFAAAGAYLLVTMLRRRPIEPGERAIGMMTACFTNAGNLGLPIAVYVLGDAAWMAPVLLPQLVILQPAFLTYLDLWAGRATGERRSWWRYLLLPMRNPITVAVLLGIAANVFRVPIPEVITAPLDLLGGMAVPAMLVAFGISLRLDPLLAKGTHAGHGWAIVVIKLIVHPAAAFGLALAFGLNTDQTLAVTVSAALPAAQNIFVIADRYGTGRLVARDAIFWSTTLCVPVIVFLSLVIR